MISLDLLQMPKLTVERAQIIGPDALALLASQAIEPLIKPVVGGLTQKDEKLTWSADLTLEEALRQGNYGSIPKDDTLEFRPYGPKLPLSLFLKEVSIGQDGKRVIVNDRTVLYSDLSRMDTADWPHGLGDKRKNKQGKVTGITLVRLVRMHQRTQELPDASLNVRVALINHLVSLNPNKPAIRATLTGHEYVYPGYAFGTIRELS
jgi:hypothetical protein